MRSNVWAVQTVTGAATDPPEIKVVRESPEPALGSRWSRPSSLSVGSVTRFRKLWWSEKVLPRQSPVFSREAASFVRGYLVLQKKPRRLGSFPNGRGPRPAALGPTPGTLSLKPQSRGPLFQREGVEGLSLF